MTTTPKNIDYNGLQINSLDGTTNIITTMNGTNKGLSLNYDLLTVPKLFTLTINGFTLSSNSSSFLFVCLLQQLLQALQIPPNSTTLKLNNTLRMRQGSNIITFTTSSSPSRLTIDIFAPYYVNFLVNPRTSVLPSSGNDLTNRQYCLNLVNSRGNVIDSNLGSNYYLMYASGTNINLYTNLTNPNTGSPSAGIQYNPNAGGFVAPSFTSVGGNTRVRFGGAYTTNNFVAFSVLLGSGWINTQEPTSAPNGAIAIGLNCQQFLVPAAGVSIGNGSAQTFINTGASAGSASINTVSIGKEANNTYPNRLSIAIGARACYTKINAQTTAVNPQDVSIGYESAYSSTVSSGIVSTSIGYRANYNQRQQNTISINASGSAISNTTASSFQMAPIRGFAVGGGVNQLFYDFNGSVTGQIGEIYYSTN